MPAPEAGCLLCGSTWGDYYEEIDGKREFFCCDICALQYRAILEEARRFGEGGSVQALEIVGDRRGRTVRVRYRSGRSLRFWVAFNALGGLRATRSLGDDLA
ncbi:MAG: TA0938 family protein [Candidatus Lutacidiplasmatales archaeon]